MNRNLIVTCLLLGLALSAGCAKGALWRLGYLSPQARKQWAEEEKLAKTWPTIREEMNGLVAQAKVSSPADQQRLAKRFAEIIEKDNRILVRLHATQLLGELPPEASLAALEVAARDRESEVRVAACRAYGKLRSDDALLHLNQLLRRDSHPDVQIAAVRALGEFKSPRATQALAFALEAEQPALQLAAADSLKKITGEKFGKDIPKWQDYVSKLNPPTDQSNAVSPAAHQESDEVRSFLNSLGR